MKTKAGNPHQISPRDYLSVLFRRRKVFLLPALIVFFTATIGSFLLPRYYASSVLVLVQEEKNVINPLAPDYRRYVSHLNDSTNLVETLKTLTEKIFNYPQMRMVISTLGLDQGKNPLEVEKTISAIRKRTDIRLRSPEVFEITYEDRDPEMAQKLVNTMVKSFIDYDISRKRNRAMIGVDFAESQADVYREKLAKSENELYEFRRQYAMMTPGKETDVNVSLLINYQTALVNNQLSMQELGSTLSQLQDQLSGNVPLPINSEILESNPLIESLKEQLKQAQLQLESLQRSDPGSKRITDLELQIDDLRQRLSEETVLVMDSQFPQNSPVLYGLLRNDMEQYESRMKSLRERDLKYRKLVDEYESRLESLPEQDRIYAELLRDNRVNSNIYEMLRMKVEENRLDAVELQNTGINYDILSEGRLPLIPSRPRKLLISLAALFMGGLIGIGAVFLVESGDRSIKNSEDAEIFLDIPVLGSTQKIITPGELLKLRAGQRRGIMLFAGLLLILIIFAGLSSCIQEKRLTERLVRDQLSSEAAE